LGYTGSCGDLASQFSDLPGAYVYGDPGEETCHDTLADYVCHAFPDDSNYLDQIYVGLISMVVVLPVSLGLRLLARMACEIYGAQNGWLSFTPIPRFIYGGLRATCWWHWSGQTRHRPRKLVRWLALNPNPYWHDIFYFCVPHFFRRLIDARIKRRPEEPPPPLLGVLPPFRSQSLSEKETATEVPRDYETQQARSRRALICAVLGFYVVWAIMAYFAFVHGLIISTCLSGGAETKFAGAWGWSQAFQQLRQLGGVARGAFVAAIVMVILDVMRLTTDARFFDEYLDHASVQATLFAGGAASLWQQLPKMLRFYKRIEV